MRSPIDPTALVPDWPLIAIVVAVAALLILTVWFWVGLLAPQDPSTKPLVTDRGSSPLRDHPTEATIELRRRKVKPSQRGRNAEDWGE